MNQSPAALLTLKAAQDWLAAQSLPLSSPAAASMAGPWQRRLIEACALFVAQALETLAREMEATCPSAAPDARHPDACVSLRIVGQARHRQANGSMGPWGPGILVEPSLSASSAVAGKGPSISLAAPAAKLALPAAIGEAFTNNLLSKALRAQCEGSVFFFLGEGLSHSLSQALPPSHPWQAELAASVLEDRLPQAPRRAAGRL